MLKSIQVQKTMRKLDGDGGHQNVGKRVILPSSFIGGDRYMHQEYLDSIFYINTMVILMVLLQ